jgi:hypothetical protein
MLKSVVFAAAAFVMAAPAFAQAPPASPAAAASAQKVKDPNRIICEREEEIGTRLGGKKTCRTAQEWQEWRQRNREQVDDWQRRFTSPGKPGG